MYILGIYRDNGKENGNDYMVILQRLSRVVSTQDFKGPAKAPAAAEGLYEDPDFPATDESFHGL